jgi:hypothetical protein
MATLKIEIPDEVYENIKKLAAAEMRSATKQVVHMLTRGAAPAPISSAVKPPTPTQVEKQKAKALAAVLAVENREHSAALDDFYRLDAEVRRRAKEKDPTLTVDVVNEYGDKMRAAQAIIDRVVASRRDRRLAKEAEEAALAATSSDETR